MEGGYKLVNVAHCPYLRESIKVRVMLNIKSLL